MSRMHYLLGLPKQAAKSIFVDHVTRVSCQGKNIIKGHIKINQLATIAYCAVLPVTTKADTFKLTTYGRNDMLADILHGENFLAGAIICLRCHNKLIQNMLVSCCICKNVVK